MSDAVSRVTPSLSANIERQIELRRLGKRKQVRHGGLLCSHCLKNPPAAPDRWCAECRRDYSRERQRNERRELKRLRALEQEQLSKGKDNGQGETKEESSAGS